MKQKKICDNKKISQMKKDVSQWKNICDDNDNNNDNDKPKKHK